MEYEVVKRVLAALERELVRYVVFGAAALNLHGLARFTEALDLFVAADAENVEALERALHSVFDDPHIDEITHADLAGDHPAIQYVPPEGSFHLAGIGRWTCSTRRRSGGRRRRRPAAVATKRKAAPCPAPPTAECRNFVASPLSCPIHVPACSQYVRAFGDLGASDL